MMVYNKGMTKYKLTIPTPENCFICHDKIGLGFDKESLEYIQTLTLCSVHRDSIGIALRKLDREPGSYDN